MKVRLYFVTMGTGKVGEDGVESEMILNIFTNSGGAEEFSKRFPGSAIRKMVATPEGTEGIRDETTTAYSIDRVAAG